MEYSYEIIYRLGEDRMARVQCKTRKFETALRAAKVASRTHGLASIRHIPTGKIICYCANGMVA